MNYTCFLIIHACTILRKTGCKGHAWQTRILRWISLRQFTRISFAMFAPRPNPYKPPYVLVRTLMNTKDPDKAFSETSTYIEFWGPQEIVQHVVYGLSVKPVSDGNNITCKTTEAPYYVLSRLKENGYRVVGVSSVGETCVWTCEFAPSHWMRRNSDERWSCVIEESGKGSLGYFLTCYNDVY